MDPTPKAATTLEEDQATVRLGGYLSGSAEATLAPAFAEAAQAKRIVAVFAPDCFLNSAGIAVLLAMLLPLKDQGKDVRIVHPSAHFCRVFQIVGLTQDVPVFADEQAARDGW